MDTKLRRRTFLQAALTICSSATTKAPGLDFIQAAAPTGHSNVQLYQLALERRGLENIYNDYIWAQGNGMINNVTPITSEMDDRYDVLGKLFKELEKAGHPHIRRIIDAVREQDYKRRDEAYELYQKRITGQIIDESNGAPSSIEEPSLSPEETPSFDKKPLAIEKKYDESHSEGDIVDQVKAQIDNLDDAEEGAATNIIAQEIPGEQDDELTEEIKIIVSNAPTVPAPF